MNSDGKSITVDFVIAAIVATGLIAGYVMHAWIVAYWMVLTMKNLVDYINGRGG